MVICWPSLMFLFMCVSPPPCLNPHMAFLPCVYVQISPFYKDSSHIDWDLSSMTSFNLIISKKHLLKRTLNKVLPKVLGVKSPTFLESHNSTHNSAEKLSGQYGISTIMEKRCRLNSLLSTPAFLHLYSFMSMLSLRSS